MPGRGWWIGAAVLSFASAAHAGLYAKAGWEAHMPLGSHQSRGTATIIDDHTIQIEDFYYDGGGISVYFYLGAANTSSAFSSGLQIGPQLLGTTFSGDSLTLTLPGGESLDDYSAISVWCVVAGVSFTSASFAPPGTTYDRAGAVADINGIFHSVDATATIINDHLIHVEHFTYDGGAPAVYFYLGADNTDSAFLDGLELPPHLDRAYADESLVLTVPSAENLDDYTAISVWCAQFHVNFGSAVFIMLDPADADGDGDVDLADHAAFVGCMAGAGSAPNAGSLSAQQCLDAFDADVDGDVDLADEARMQRVFTGP